MYLDAAYIKGSDVCLILFFQTTIPHAYGVTDCTIDKLIALRKQLKDDGIKLSVNDFVIKAVALALQQCPQVNALYKGEEVCCHHHQLTN